ncbi:MAG: phosphatase PAP2 family protein [Bacteroidetes bacterium]|nr:phosphatase PAP2 family protein [Bacteroidota bacterium]
MLEKIDQLDKQLAVWFNGLHTQFWDTVMVFISGKYEWIPFYAVIMALIIYRFRKNSLLIIPVIVLLITLADQSSVHLFKFMFERLRPCHSPDIGQLLHLPDGCGGQFGFVSSHASNTFALAAFISLLFRNRNGTIIMYVWAGIISLSRVYLGKHYFTDIFFGAMLGILIGWLCYKLLLFLIQKIYGDSGLRVK